MTTTLSAEVLIGDKRVLTKALSVDVHDVQPDDVTVKEVAGTSSGVGAFTTIRVSTDTYLNNATLYLLGSAAERAAALKSIADKLAASADDLLLQQAIDTRRNA